MFYRGSTVTLVFNVKNKELDLSQIDICHFTIANDSRRNQRTIENCILDNENKKIKVPLSQNDTLSFEPGYLLMQFKIGSINNNDYSIALSNIMRSYIEQDMEGIAWTINPNSEDPTEGNIVNLIETIGDIQFSESEFTLDLEFEGIVMDTVVIPNPPEEPEEQLNTVLIKNKVYDIGVNPDWNEDDITSKSFIQNKPVIPAAQVQVDWAQDDSSEIDFIKNKPSIPDPQIQSNWLESDNSKVDFIKNKPTKLSDFNNDQGFIDNTVNNLTNYYKKSETYTQQEVNTLIAAIATISIEVVQELPITDIQTNIIYLVPTDEPNPDNIYEEYIYVNNNWEMIGTTKVDLSNYYTKTQTDTLLNGKVDKVEGYGLSENDCTDTLKTDVEECALSVGNMNTEAFGFSEVDYEQGYWAIADGTAMPGTAWIRTVGDLPSNTREVSIDTSTNIVAFVLGYENSIYKGYWNGATWTKTYNASDAKQYYDIKTLKANYSTYSFRLSIHRTNSSTLPVSESSHVHTDFVYPSLIQAVNSAEDLSIKTGWRKGIMSATGNLNDGNGATTDIMKYVDKLVLGNQCRAVILVYRDTYYIGKINSNGNVDQVGGSWKYYTGEVDIKEICDKFSVNGVVLSVLPTDSTTITPQTVTEYGNSHLSGQTLHSGDIANKTAQNVFILCSTDDSVIYSINHRGFNKVAPENTLPAYKLSKINGFRYVECDVQFTSDKVPVLLHDLTINRTARNADGTEISGDVAIADITYEEALEYDFGIWKGEEWEGTKIPTFEEFILLCKRLSLKPVIELKDYTWNSERISIISNIITSLGMADACSFISFQKSPLSQISEVFPKAMLGFGLNASSTVENVTAAINSAMDLETGENKVFLIIDNYGLPESVYDLFLTSEIGLFLVVINTEKQIVELNKVVMGVLSDNLNASEVLARQTLFEFLES